MLASRESTRSQRAGKETILPSPYIPSSPEYQGNPILPQWSVSYLTGTQGMVEC